MKWISFLENPLNLTIQLVDLEWISILDIQSYHFHFLSRDRMDLHFGEAFKLNNLSS